MDGAAADFDYRLLQAELEAVAVAADAEPMRAYMKDRFAFLGVKTPARRDVSRSFVAAGGDVDPSELPEIAARLWEYDYREYQQIGCDLLKRWRRRLEPDAIGTLEQLITTKSWWDTVDVLAAHVVGTLVSRHDELLDVMDDWICDNDLWLVRSAILHQLFYKDSTDTDRLFGYAERQMGHDDFFIRKAIGWALRQYARTDASAVITFVAEHENALSGLTKREALKHIGTTSG